MADDLVMADDLERQADEARALFRAQEWEHARDKFKACADACAAAKASPNTTNTETAVLRLKMLNNASQCCLNLNENQDCMKYAYQVLRGDP